MKGYYLVESALGLRLWCGHQIILGLEPALMCDGIKIVMKDLENINTTESTMKEVR